MTIKRDHKNHSMSLDQIEYAKKSKTNNITCINIPLLIREHLFNVVVEL